MRDDGVSKGLLGLALVMTLALALCLLAGLLTAMGMLGEMAEDMAVLSLVAGGQRRKRPPEGGVP